ncbi:MAG TPA: hypothetical protein VK420_16875, partial [Longimicrobium sp.]|nr:hypothetical protein [Longimicrobium sp.]
GSMYEMRVPEYLLVNRDRGEALELRMERSSGSDFALVLPGPRAQSSTTGLVPNVRLGEAPRIEPAWLAGARLLRVSWVPLGSVPVFAEDRGRGYKEWTAEIAPRGRGR